MTYVLCLRRRVDKGTQIVQYKCGPLKKKEKEQINGWSPISLR